MNKQTNYFFLSAFFLVAFLISQFSDIYKSPTWFKAFVLILSITFLISGISNSQSKKNE
ncbi:MAG: hypothetical protein R2805_11755 [Flavobacterium sp.]|uniref:hypothetical protein n=1 Tax=Flavobacterium sp. TaxID=239 RepID=UPI0035279500